MNCLQRCEEQRLAKLQRWHKLKRMVADLEGVRQALVVVSWVSFGRSSRASSTPQYRAKMPPSDPGAPVKQCFGVRECPPSTRTRPRDSVSACLSQFPVAYDLFIYGVLRHELS